VRRGVVVERVAAPRGLVAASGTRIVPGAAAENAILMIAKARAGQKR
jgi:hypothetical protein